MPRLNMKFEQNSSNSSKKRKHKQTNLKQISITAMSGVSRVDKIRAIQQDLEQWLGASTSHRDIYKLQVSFVCILF